MRRLAAWAGAFALTASPVLAQDHSGHDMAGMDHDMSPALSHAMQSPLGPYAMSRDASGTAWQPQASPGMGAHAQSGDWMTMRHALFNVVFDRQGGPRGDEKTFVSGMAMAMAQRPLGPGRLGLKAMLSPDPLMGKSGYPLLLAAGESADGTTTLVDRQHPHDLFMELSASYSLPLGETSSAFIYAGLPGEPAFGPPSFMHRLSTFDSPEAPISHHWLDSTHITFGVVTAGYVRGDWKLEASAFRGREPDESRFDIETGRLDSTAARISWNPSPSWAWQVSWARINSPEALEPDQDESRLSLSAIHVRRFGDAGTWATTAALGRKDPSQGEALWAGLVETALMPNGAWTLFARGEWVEQAELLGGHGPAHQAGRLSAGVIRDWRLSPRVKLGLGGLVSRYRIPEALAGVYGEPTSGMAFLRLALH